MHERTRIDNYRGRKDSALALHYLWRVGEAMVVRRERFERVYAMTERMECSSQQGECVDDVQCANNEGSGASSNSDGVPPPPPLAPSTESGVGNQ